METLHSAVAFITFKPLYVRWANTCIYDKAFFDEHRIAVLIPCYTFKLDASRYVNEVWEDMFREALKWWEGSEYLWPKDRTRKIFGQWFEVRFVPTVIASDQED